MDNDSRGIDTTPLTSTCYDGKPVTTEWQSRTKHPAQSTAKLHRWTVRARLYATGINVWPEIPNWRDT